MRDKNRLLILAQDSARYVELIKKLDFTDLEFVACESIEEAKKSVEHCHMILGEPALIGPILEGAKKLQWVQSTFAGVEALVGHGKRTNYILTGVKEVFGPLMSEYVFAYILALERHIFELYENQKERVWEKMPYCATHHYRIDAGTKKVTKMCGCYVFPFRSYADSCNTMG